MYYVPYKTKSIDGIYSRKDIKYLRIITHSMFEAEFEAIKWLRTRYNDTQFIILHTKIVRY